MKNCFSILFLILTFSCLSPKNIDDFDDEDIASVVSIIASQAERITGKTLQKELILLQGSSQNKFIIDSVFFHRDFEVLKGKNLSHIFQPSSYEKHVSDSTIEFRRKKNEKMGPNLLRISKFSDGKIQTIYIEEYSKNLLFNSSEISTFSFDNNQSLERYSIEGFQKLIGMDESRHQVKGTIQ